MFEKIVAMLMEQQSLEPNTQKHDFWTDGYDIICSSQERADVVADLLEDCGEDVVCTGTYDDDGKLFYIHLNGM